MIVRRMPCGRRRCPRKKDPGGGASGPEYGDFQLFEVVAKMPQKSEALISSEHLGAAVSDGAPPSAIENICGRILLHGPDVGYRKHGK